MENLATWKKLESLKMREKPVRYYLDKSIRCWISKIYLENIRKL